MKLYFANDIEDKVASLDEWKDFFKIIAKKERGTEIKLIPAKREINSKFFFCTEFNEVMGKDELSCGKNNCDYYKPRNRKNGICKYNTYVYEKDDSKKSIIVKI